MILMKWREEKLLMRNQSTNIVYPNKENALIVPNHKMNREYYKNLCLTHLIDELLFIEEWREKKLLIGNQSINIVYPNEKNVFIVLNQ